MTPSIDLRIATMVRAIADVVTPAIDPDNSLAREQAALVLGHLKLLAIQWNRADAYARICCADIAEVIDGLVPEGGAMTEAAASALATARADDTPAETHFKAMMAALDALVRATAVDGGASFRETLRLAVLGFSARQSLRDRSWFAASGFDLRPDELRSIDSIITEAAQ